MGGWKRRGRGTRLVVTLAALASLILGYYAGQYWQRRSLSDLSAIVYPSGQRIDTIDELTALASADPAWRLFLVADTRAPACAALLRHFAHVFNRLAAWPDIQANLRLSLLAMDEPNEAAITAFTAGVSWAEVVSALYLRRSAALVTGQTSLLCEVYDPLSPGLADDITDATEIAERVRREACRANNAGPTISGFPGLDCSDVDGGAAS